MPTTTRGKRGRAHEGPLQVLRPRPNITGTGFLFESDIEIVAQVAKGTKGEPVRTTLTHAQALRFLAALAQRLAMRPGDLTPPAPKPKVFRPGKERPTFK
jgi:hypothetical protein